MLRELKVQNFALIRDLSLCLEPGFNVLTGETGAGKSLLVDALGLACGARASSDLVRSGADEAVVEALFEPSEAAAGGALDSALEERGLPAAGGVMVVRRVIDAGGRHRVYINGSLATVATLAELAEGLVAICGQHEHVTLTRRGEALALLDDFASAVVPEFPRARAAFEASWESLQEARAELVRFEEDPAARADRETFLRFQISEIESLSPRPGEIEELELEQRRLAGAGRLQQAADQAESELYSSDGAVGGVLARVHRRIEECTRVDPTLREIADQLASAMAIVTEAGRDLGDYARGLDSDPARMGVVEGRLSALKRLARRHGGDLLSACDALVRLQRELGEIEEHDARFAEAQRLFAAAEELAIEAAWRLGRAREAAAEHLDGRVRDGLDRLGMAGGRVALMVRRGELGRSGFDRVEIGLATDPGSPLRPISKVASGGELSRLLLAFRRAIAEVDGVETVVFDEVDAGVGGAVAEAVGRLMAEVASRRQVLCVTHLPQLAVHASHHAVVEKVVEKGGVHIRASSIRGKARIEELGRMLGGAEVTSATRANAKDLLDSASRDRIGTVESCRQPRSPGRPRRRRDGGAARGVNP